MQNNAQAPRERDSAATLKAGHLKTRANLSKPAAKPKSFSPKLAGDRAWVAEPTD